MKSFWEKRPLLIPSGIAALMLVGALADWPYGYYQLLRWVVCGASIFVAYTTYSWKKVWATWIFGFIALLFNPLIPIHLTREIWKPIDVICAILFIIIVFILSEPKEQNKGDE